MSNDSLLSRRGLLTGAIAGGAALMLPRQLTGAQHATPAAHQFPITVTTMAGTAELAAPATRIVALSYPDVDTVVALGVTPVAVQPDSYSPTLIPPWLEGKLEPEQTVILDLSGDLPLESFVAAAPDLILDTLGFRATPAITQLQEIAPTVVGLPESTDNSLITRTELIGALLGKSAEAQTALAEVDATIDHVPTDNPALAGKTYAYGYVGQDTIGIITAPENFTTQLFGRWGMQVAPALLEVKHVEGQAPGSATLSYEQIGLLEADAIILGFGSPELQTQLEESPLFAGLTAVQEGRYFPITQDVTVAIQVPSIANLPWVVGQLDPVFTRLTEG